MSYLHFVNFLDLCRVSQHTAGAAMPPRTRSQTKRKMDSNDWRMAEDYNLEIMQKLKQRKFQKHEWCTSDYFYTYDWRGLEGKQVVGIVYRLDDSPKNFIKVWFSHCETAQPSEFCRTIYLEKSKMFHCLFNPYSREIMGS